MIRSGNSLSILLKNSNVSLLKRASPGPATPTTATVSYTHLDVYKRQRLATERRRLSQQVADKEIIVDMFTGIGPFSISIAKEHTVKIYAIDINPDAYKYLKENIKLNKPEGTVIPLLGDVKEVLKGLNIKSDRIIMNLPGTAWSFLDIAIKSLKSGGVLHYYEFASEFQIPIDKIIDCLLYTSIQVT